MATYIIAEAGVNHNGDLLMARELIERAARCGADAVKFQSFDAKDIVTSSGEKAKYQKENDGTGSQRNMLKNLQMNEGQHTNLMEHCVKNKIQFLSTPFGIPQLNLLLELDIKALKIASGEITNLPLLEEIARASSRKKLPIFLSTGMCSLGDVEAGLQIFLNEGIERSQITLMHCLSSYPAPANEVNLKAIKTLSKSFKCPVGYSDHTKGITAPIAAVSLGAKVIEKHITLDNDLPGPDHKASLEPDEFKFMVDAIRETEELLGSGIKELQDSERNTRSIARRSIRAARLIKKGEVLDERNLTCKRPNDGLSPMLLKQVLGQVADMDYKEDQCIDSRINENS